MGITAVLNAAQGTMSEWNFINTKASYYAKDNIAFMGIPAIDFKHYPICDHFEDTNKFINDEVKLKNGKNGLEMCPHSLDTLKGSHCIPPNPSL